jgi:SAM-dependent methyltransferase
MGETAEPPSEASLQAVCSAFGISPDGVALEHLRSVLGKVYQFDHSFLEAENNYLLQRLAIDRNGRSTVDAMARQGSGATKFAVVRHYIPEELACAAKTSHNVRIRNIGEEPLTRFSLGGWELRGHWTDAAGEVQGEAGKPSRLPVSVLPGRELTVPFWLDAPAAPGEYRLAFSLTCGDRSIGDASGSIRLRVRETVTRDYPPIEPTWGQLQPDYDEDHRVGIRIMERVVQATRARRGLEIGGSSCPMTTNLPVEIINTDIDAQTLQVANFVFGRRGHRNVAFACCDALDLPFARGAFDFAAIFSSLHHFADPTAALRSVVETVKSNGFLAVMCEPVGHYYDDPDPEMQGVLEHGINEQRFTLDEYARIFQDAGLRPVSSQVDHDSLKVILARIGSELPLFDPPPASPVQP